MIGTTLGKYTILEELGRGGMAVVFKARDNDLGRMAALKVLSSEFTADKQALNRFLREAKMCARLNHPAIIKIFDIGEHEGQNYFSMEMLSGSLHDVIKKEGKLPIDKAVELVVQVLKGLECAHEAGIIHRDLKPENIMMNAGGQPVLVDFGIAKSQKGARLTQTGILLGTPYYMSPEQITGKEIKVTSDLYSMGVVLYELLTANVPFQADSTFMITYKHCTENPPPPRKLNEEVSEDLQKVVLKALEKDPRKRYQTAREMFEDLEKVQKGMAVDVVIETRKDITSIPEFAEAMERYNGGLWQEAAEGFSRVADECLDVDFASEAQRWCATAHYEKGDWSEAIRQHKRTLDRWPESAEAKRVPIYIDGCCFQMLQHGETLYHRRKKEEACAVFEALLNVLETEQIPLESNIWTQHAQAKLAQTRAEIKRWKFLRAVMITAAAAIFCAVSAITVYFAYIDRYAYYSVLAVLQRARGNLSGEITAYGDALAEKPGDVEALVGLGDAYLRQAASLPAQESEQARTDRQRALGYLRDAVSAGGRSAAAHRLLGQAHGALGDYQAAVTATLESLKFESDAQTYTNLGYFYGRLGKTKEEMEAYVAAIKADESFAPAWNNLGAAYESQEKWAQAEQALLNAVRLDERYGIAWHNLGKARFGKGDVDGAREAFDQALRFVPEWPDLHYQLARLASKGGQEATAIVELEFAIKYARSYPGQGDVARRAHADLGAIYRVRGDVEKAVGHFVEAHLLAPQEPAYLQTLAELHAGLRDWDRAADYYGRLVNIRPQSAEACHGRGLALLEKGDLAGAIRDLSRAVALDGRSARFQAGLARALEAAKRPDEAMQRLALARRLDPREAEHALRHGQLLLGASRLDEAYAAFAQAAALDGTRPEPVWNMGRVLVAQGKGEQALQAFRKALEIRADWPEALMSLGVTLYRMGRAEEALPVLERFVAQAPYHGAVSQIRGLIRRIRP